MRRIFGPKRDEVTGEWSRLHNEKLYDLYCSQNIIWVNKSRRVGLAGHVARMGERIVVYRVLVGRREGKRPLGRTRVDGSIILRQIFKNGDGHGGGGMDWVDLTQDRDRWRVVVNAVMNLRVA